VVLEVLAAAVDMTEAKEEVLTTILKRNQENPVDLQEDQILYQNQHTVQKTANRVDLVVDQDLNTLLLIF
jgi:hypothetical protein